MCSKASEVGSGVTGTGGGGSLDLGGGEKGGRALLSAFAGVESGRGRLGETEMVMRRVREVLRSLLNQKSLM
jgi:hypothetical protein